MATNRTRAALLLGSILCTQIAHGAVRKPGRSSSWRATFSTHERYAYLGVTLVDSVGVPAIATDVLPTVVHEFSHSLVNPLMSGQTSAMRGSGEHMFRAVEAQMRALAYTSWPTMLNESMVRAPSIQPPRVLSCTSIVPLIRSSQPRWTPKSGHQWTPENRPPRQAG
jgi:Domain of unknown function (DUF4932)